MRFMVAMIALFIGDALSGSSGPSGLVERLLALTGAGWIFLLARGVSQRPGGGRISASRRDGRPPTMWVNH
jgi:hypothetical protein